MSEHAREQPTELEAPGGVRIPANRFYCRQHLWFLPLPSHGMPAMPCPLLGTTENPLQGRQTGRAVIFRLGLTAYVCRWGVEVYFIENVASIGTVLPQGGRMATIETEKTVLDVNAPFECRVCSVNQEVMHDPSLITFDNYGAGWIMEAEGNLSGLWSAAVYAAYLKTLPPPQCFAGS